MIFAFSGEPMGYEHLFGKSDLALLYDWLQETGELYMDLDRPHSGGSNNGVHFIESLAALKGIVSHERHPEVYISIFRLKQYPIRGIAGDSLLATVLEQIPDRQWFSIVSLGDGPLAPCNVIGFGDCHDEMREEFARLEGKHVRVGQNPYDLADTFSNRPEEVFVVYSYKHPPSVSKNRTAYDPYDSEPDRYRPYIDFW
jgi:hypothetical protein